MHVHFMGVCGYAIGGAALLARARGDRVTGSDEEPYPPMTEILTAAGVEWVDGYSAGNLSRWGVPQLVVVAARIREGNPELDEARRLGVRTVSEAELYTELARDRTRVAVCGTHGKTTTAALLAHMLATAGLDPGFRLGSTSRDFGASARLGSGPFVIEGDEYATAPWDPRPKFLHARPALACVTRLELDHPDIYPDLAAYRAPFVELARTMPEDGLLVLCADDPECLALAAEASCPVTTYGWAEQADWSIGTLGIHQGRSVIEVVHGHDAPRAVELWSTGHHVAQNAVAALALAGGLGAPVDACAAACRSFRGAARRFEVLGSPGRITVIDDYAHHPTEVAATIEAARSLFGELARLIVVYVPHTYSRTLALRERYADAFAGAEAVILGPIEPAREHHLARTVSSHDLAALIRGVPVVEVARDPDEAIARAVAWARPGGAVLCLSVAGFEGIAGRLVRALEAADGGG